MVHGYDLYDMPMEEGVTAVVIEVEVNVAESMVVVEQEGVMEGVETVVELETVMEVVVEKVVKKEVKMEVVVTGA